MKPPALSSTEEYASLGEACLAQSAGAQWCYSTSDNAGKSRFLLSSDSRYLAAFRHIYNNLYW